MTFQQLISVLWTPKEWLDATLVTLSYGIASTVVGLVLGLILGVILISQFAPARALISLFIGLFRCTPALIQIVWFYYAMPILLDVSMPPWLAAGFGLTFYMAAFSAEIFRGGIESIDRGQWNACRTLCMSHWQTMYYIVLPQAIRRMLPPLVNQSVIQMKNTALLSVVAIHDIMYTANIRTSVTYRPLALFTFASALYIIIIWPMTSLAYRFEQRSSRPG